MIYIRTYNSSTNKESWSKTAPGGVACLISAPTEGFSVTNNTWVTVPFATISDTTHFTNTSGVIKPIIAGSYLVTYAFYTSNQSIGAISVRFNHTDRQEFNGYIHDNLFDNASATSLFYFDGTADTLALQVKQTSGSSRQMCMNGTDYYAFMTFTRVAEG